MDTFINEIKGEYIYLIGHLTTFHFPNLNFGPRFLSFDLLFVFDDKSEDGDLAPKFKLGK